MNLVEMVMAIAITGLVVTGMITTTAQTLVNYQEADADLRTRIAHESAGLRARQIANAIWRDAEPPTDHGGLNSAKVGELGVGDWVFRDSTNVLKQRWNAGPYAALTGTVQGFTFQYLLSDGTWLSQPLNPTQRNDVLALKFSWTDPGSGQTFGGWTVTPDRQFAQGSIGLPAPDTSGIYNRSDYEQTFSFSLGSWP